MRARRRRGHRDQRELTVYGQLLVAILAFGLAAMAMMQAISRANLDLPFRTPSMYYMPSRRMAC
jgi:hypothetical protein